MKKIIITISALGLLIPAFASAELNYNAVQLGYAKTTESGQADLNEFDLGVSYSINKNFYIQGLFASGTQASGTPAGDVTFTGWDVGLGAHTPIGTNVDIVGIFDLVLAKAELGSISESGNGYAMSVGLRGEFTPQLEGTFFGHYSSVTANSSTTTATGVNAGLAYNFSPQIQLGVDIGSTSHSPDVGSSYSTETLGIVGRYFY